MLWEYEKGLCVSEIPHSPFSLPKNRDLLRFASETLGTGIALSDLKVVGMGHSSIMTKSMDDIVVLVIELLPKFPYRNRGYADASQNRFIVDMELTEAVMGRLQEAHSPQLENLVYYQVTQCRPEQ